ncbi:hypothetical protein B0O80DRAFT_440341 [Mortierella sp. GBAus27b]|nr:hypothetical protein B0O80DRAFT_440341 [Mortierella sp. GBAus27b]
MGGWTEEQSREQNEGCGQTPGMSARPVHCHEEWRRGRGMGGDKRWGSGDNENDGGRGAMER